MNDSYGASETGAAGQRGRREHHARPPAFATDGRTWVLDPETLEPLEPGSGVEGLFARTGNIPLGYWKDPEKTAATFRTDARRRALGRARRLGDDRRRGPRSCCSAAVRAASTPAARRSSPRRSRPRSGPIPTCSTRSSSACPTTLRAEGRRARAAARRRAELDARRAAGALPHEDRGLQGAARAAPRSTRRTNSASPTTATARRSPAPASPPR